MRCPPISQHHRRGRRAGAEASRLINEAGHAPRIGAGNGALGQATVHWGRQIAYPNACFPAPMRLTVLGAHCSRGLEPRSAPKNAPSAPRSGQRGSSAVPTDCVQHTPRRRPVFTAIPRSAWADPQGCPVQRLCFHSNTTLSQRYHTLQALQHLQSDGIPLKTPLHLQTTPAPAQRQRNVGIPGENSCNPPNEPDFPLRTRHRLQNIPSPRPSTILLCVTKVRRVPQPALHAPGQTRALIGAGNSALEQETDHWGRLITCPNAD